ncbi:hypothetical protein [Bacteriovorax sp. Seq25_V]|uniref:hypothetical protein n=1 Tax=Bacteriovorax sp. Seq25_V TaxID=1201288 RepID=UPI00038A1889|nr:hypothetical protein [Bacteriovorax sp. Seq25_V]EQC43946.1 hypothetical protein M900_1440 [Bacteriovorax sp. Seq25_V]
MIQKISAMTFFLIIGFQSFAQDICKQTKIEDQNVIVCFSETKVCKYFNYHDMAPTLTYDCWSNKDDDRNSAKRSGCSNGDENWPECADGYILE